MSVSGVGTGVGFWVGVFVGAEVGLGVGEPVCAWAGWKVPNTARKNNSNAVYVVQMSGLFILLQLIINRRDRCFVRL